MLGARTYLLREGIHRFAAAWVRVRAAFGDGQSVSICETTLVVRGSGRAFLYLSIYLSTLRYVRSARSKARRWRWIVFGLS